MSSLRRTFALALVALLAVFGSACSDDDKDGEAEVEVPEVEVNPDDDSNTNP